MYRPAKSRAVFFIVILVSAVLLFPSCDEDDDTAPASSFLYKGNTYALTNGYIIPGQDNGNGTFTHRVGLFTEGVVEGSTPTGFSGTGSGLLISMTTTNPSNIQEGDYTASSANDALTYKLQFLAIDDSVSALTNLEPAGNGPVEVSVSSDTYTIVFDLNVPQSIGGFEILFGTYIGTLQ